MIYREDDWKAEVEILEDSSDKEWARYKLKVVKILRESVLNGIQEGEEFDVSHKKGAVFCGMWTLRED